MSIETFQDILPHAARPSRYLGSEINSIKKDPGDVALRIALAFPDLYEIGTSHFGIQILYHLFNQRPEIAAERVFAPGEDVEEMLRENGVPLCALESKTPLAEFDIVGFSLLYELNYTNVLNMLDLSGIPFHSTERSPEHPFIIAGGPCTCNPEPVADFFDAMVIGDGEPVVLAMADIWLEWKKDRNREREDLLKKWAEIEGVYIPEFFEARIDENGFQHVTPKFPYYNKVKRAIAPDLSRQPFPCAPVMPHGKPIHDRLRLEVARGCTRGCRFCQAGMIYRPVRERNLDAMIRLSDGAIAGTGYEDVSLLSLSTGDYGSLIPLMKWLMEAYEDRHIAVSLPSLRAGSLTPELITLIKKVRKTGFTIAPEAGSQRLRDIINKNIDENEIVEAVRNSFELGWNLIKLYFMIGLPMEEKEDLRAIVQLVRKLKNLPGKKGKKRGKKNINVSVATFIPKPHTPFQWAPLLPLKESRERIMWLKDELRSPGVNFKWQAPEVSFLEGLWARGDRGLSKLLVAAHRKGCTFDGWTDKFDFGLWQEAIEETGVNTDFYTSRTRSADEPLPWDHIDLGVTKDFLEEEWKKSRTGQPTADCREGECNDCGVCDFKTVEPRVCQSDPVHGFPVDKAPKSERSDKINEKIYRKIEVSYSKLGPAKYFGHLELINVISRAISRSGVPVKYTEGFHPKLKIAFDNPLPVGVESRRENFYIHVGNGVKPRDVVEKLKNRTPEGIEITGSRLAPKKKKAPKGVLHTYRFRLGEGGFSREKLDEFENAPHVHLEKKNKKGRIKKIDLKEIVRKIERMDEKNLEMTLWSEPGRTVKASNAIRKIFGIDDEKTTAMGILKL